MAYQYENAPIKEALIDIRVELPQDVSLAALEQLHADLRDRYPGEKKRTFVQAQFLVGTEVGAAAKQKDMGFMFSSADGLEIAQLRLDGFTFSRLRPYLNWPALRDEARRLWGVYASSVHPMKIVRVAVRYINQIDIPSPTVDYKDYFRTTPEVSPDLPQGLSGFFMQLQFPQPDIDGVLILTQAAIPPPRPDMTSVVLDVDVSKEGELSGEEQAWVLLEALKRRENAFFEGSITDKTRTLFGPRKEY